VAQFDVAAKSYDTDFTNSAIGKMQRSLVWEYLTSEFKIDSQPLKILEINCGTGADALLFTKLGHQVLATDISSEMIAIVDEKNKSNNLNTKCISIQNLNELEDDSFDLIFSNFGGLNCLSKEELTQFAEVANNLLTEKGRFIAVVMTNYCLMEHLYLASKFRWKEVFRRNKKIGIPVNVNGELVHTYYYSPNEFGSIFKNHFKIKAKRPIGHFVPPSYLENFFKSKMSILQTLFKADKTLRKNEIIANWSDHFLIELVKSE